jgi:predicted helicase
MRGSLLRSFDEIHILNLHGNSNKKETCPDGGGDENAFDIKVGVAAIMAIKKTRNEQWANVRYAELYGKRERKFLCLESEDVRFEKIEIENKTAAFIPTKTSGKNEYDGGISIVELFKRYSAGIVCGKDEFCVRNARNEIEKVILDIKTLTAEQVRKNYKLGANSADWAIERAQKDIETNDGNYIKIAYRPFDDRWSYYTGTPNGFHSRPQSEVMKNFVNKENIGLIFARGDTAR